MPLKLSLKPHEKFVLNGAVVTNGDKRASLVLQLRREFDRVHARHAAEAIAVQNVDPGVRRDRRRRCNQAQRARQQAAKFVRHRLSAGAGAGPAP